jgi:hypothetical protein
MNIRPTNVREKWEDNDVWTQANLLAYSQVREYEDAEMMSARVSM